MRSPVKQGVDKQGKGRLARAIRPENHEAAFALSIFQIVQQTLQSMRHKGGDKNIIQGVGIVTVCGKIDGTAVAGTYGNKIGKDGHGYSVSE